MRISIPDSDLSYYLASFDKHGSERREDQGFQSDELKTLLASEQDPVTDVFLVTHGWKGDVPAAIEQCNRWMGEMAKMGQDRLAVREKEPGFRALLLGIHWPSQPWGDESLDVDDGGLLLGGATGAQDGLDTVVDQFAESISDSPEARAAIERILLSATEDAGKLKLSPDVVQAYATLVSEADLWSDEAGGDQPNGHWNPQDVYDLARTSQANDLVLGGGGIKDIFLSPLRQLSFWTMKSRARKVGETGVAKLLRELQGATARPVRFHLMGHSFGCIVSSAAIAGTDWRPLARPVNSLFLVQGALSLWSYAASADGQPGYFERIVSQKRVAGPIVTTWSEHDSAVGNLYPLAARLARQVIMVAYPKYGGIGSFGLQGVSGGTREIGIGNATHKYAFGPGSICNVNASAVIKNGSGASGAHSDIAHPEVAHIAWQSVLGSL